jgi:3-oxoacyl-[acyl-carrier protein] reductase
MNKNYLVIGSGGSIGVAITQKLKEEGNYVIGTSRFTSDENTLELDLLNNNQIQSLHNLNQSFDGVVFSAGYEPRYSLMDITLNHQNTMLQIHVLGPLNVIQNLYSKFNPNASIIFISSTAAYKGSYDPMYSIVKGAVLSMTRTLAVELAKKQIRVNCISPGLVEGSPVFNRMTPDFREKHLNNTLIQRLATPTDCAEAIYFLLTQQHITGQVIHINGGQYFGN